MKNIFLIGFLFVQEGLFSQNESNNWGFGGFAGLTFNNGTATAQTTYSLFQSEGCSSMSDSLGNLLFYTDGRTVKNKNNATMINGSGLEGDNSSTQSALIVKQPDSSSIYYLFTISDEFFTDGLRYSIIDMSLQSGLGEVTSKNVYIEGQAREKVAAIPHQNGIDLWIVTHLKGSNSFKSFLLSSTGLNMTPVTTNIGVSTLNGVDAIGCIKASINGNKVAVARWGLNIVEIFNFNTATGGLSGLQTLTNCIGPYGLEFSPNNKFLYVAENVVTGSNVFQYDLLAGNTTAIENSQVALGSYSFQIGSLQLGPDYKIYVAKFNAATLDVIDEPDSLGIACNYIINGLNLLGKSSRMGLSNFSPSILPVYKYSNLCYGDSTTFIIMQNDFDSVLWDFGDVTSGVNNNSININPKHLFTDTGAFVVTLVRYKGNSSYTNSYSVYISPIPTVSITSFNPDTICYGESTTITASGATTYTWDNGAGTGSSVSVSPSTTTTYTVTGTNANSCINTTQVTVTVNSLPSVSIDDFLLDTICGNSGLVGLPISTPSGGIYSGNGVIGGNFDPASAGIGTHDIIYTYTDGNSCINSDTTIITVQLCTGIENIGNDFGILIYPNPSTGQFTIEKPSDLNKEVQVKLLDVTSKLILEKVIPADQQKVEMDIRNYSKGIYYLQLIVNDEIFVKQVLKN